MRGLLFLLALLVAIPASAASHIARDPDMRTPRQAKLRPLRWASPVAARYRFESTGDPDWGGVAPVAPIVDCRGDFRTGSCGSTTFTASGSPGLASTYWRPGGGAVAGAGVAFDGVDDQFSSSAKVAGKFLLCWRGVLSSTTTERVIAYQWGSTAGEKGWYLENGSGAVIFGTSAKNVTIAAGFAASTQNVVCAAYVPGSPNTLLLNVNGTAGNSTTTTAMVASTNGVAISPSVGALYSGSMSRLTIWDLSASAWEPSAADLARMVRSQYASQGSLGEPLTVTRASAKSCSIGGAWFTVPSGHPCIGSDGLSVEGQRTQYALANCTAPADQTVTLAAGTHTLWLEGSGSVAAAVGTATATGLPCTATSASACSFTVSVGGTVTLDVTGTVDRFQVENGARSSLICATTTPVTRQADVLSVPIPAGSLSSPYTLGGTAATLDVSANASPLTIGAGQELDIAGNLTDLRFCRSPIAGDCL